MLIVCAIYAPVARTGTTSSPPPAIEHALRVASTTYHVSYWQMRTVSWCESRWNPAAVNRIAVGRRREHSSGLFQFLPSTFSHTPYAHRSIFDPTANALAAAWLVRHDGGWFEWTCRP